MDPGAIPRRDLLLPVIISHILTYLNIFYLG